MIHEPWWTKIAYIAALTSMIASVVTIVILFMFPAQAEKIDSNPIDQSIVHYMEQLAKDKPFQQWSKATYNRFPLGPEMQGWFARIMQKQKQIGYMIVQVDEEQRIRLTEYGVGAQQPFDERTLKQALLDRQKNRTTETTNKEASNEGTSQKSIASIYPYQLAPLLTIWRIEWKDGRAEWLDAQSGEWLPLKEQHLSALVNPYTNAGITENEAFIHTATKGKTNETTTLSTEELQPSPLLKPGKSQYIAPFDLYENMTWITLPPIKNVTEIPLDYQVRKWIYVQHFDNGTVNQPYSYIGIQTWNNRLSDLNDSDKDNPVHRRLDETYVIFGSQNRQAMRWIPADIALRSGSFVPQLPSR